MVATAATKGRSKVVHLTSGLRWKHSWTGRCLSEVSGERFHFLASPDLQTFPPQLLAVWLLERRGFLPSAPVTLINVKDDQLGTAIQKPYNLYFQILWHKPGYRPWCAQNNKWSTHWPWTVRGNTISGALYDIVRLSFAWLNLSSQYIYVIADIICNHPV